MASSSRRSWDSSSSANPANLNLTGRHGVGSLRAVRRHIARVRPQVVHTHLGTSDVLGGLAARSLAIPVVSTIHALQTFGEIKIMTEGGPSNATTTLVYSLYKSAFGFGSSDYGLASAQGVEKEVVEEADQQDVGHQQAAEQSDRWAGGRRRASDGRK